ncbi:MAG: IS3 family transposase [Pseudomonadota bacterium]|nr:IS3 family transposase [Pseudomonadota bacterium]
MQSLGLKSLVPLKRYRAWRSQQAEVPNVLNRQFQATRPNQKWVTDVTEFNVRGQKLYLSPVLDLYNGEIITYTMQQRPHFSLLKDMLQKAIAKRAGKEASLLHSDQGWQYQMPAYCQQLARHGLTQRMSRKGNCLDNAVMESFFAALKSERFYLRRFECIEQLQTAICQYID